MTSIIRKTEPIDYTKIIERGIEYATIKADKCIPEPIGVVVDNNGKEYAPISYGLFGSGALLVKRQNRKFLKSIINYCLDNKLFCRYSDYHRAYYISLYKSSEYERLSTFYDAIYFYLLGCGISSKLISIQVNLD